MATKRKKVRKVERSIWMSIEVIGMYGNTLHELLCKAIHEQDPKALNKLTRYVTNITVQR